MIKVDNGNEYMVIQDLDHRMLFERKDAVRMVYLANGTVRIDKQM
jgi:outer membrane lipoprotein SlyB